MTTTKGHKPTLINNNNNVMGHHLGLSITPEEAWSSIKLDVSHFHVFRNEAWAPIPNEKHKALEPKSEKYIFVGYSEYVKGYRLL